MGKACDKLTHACGESVLASDRCIDEVVMCLWSDIIRRPWHLFFGRRPSWFFFPDLDLVLLV